MSAEMVLNQVQARLASSSIGNRILYFPSVGSTMDVAKQQAKKNASEGTVIISNKQTSGRGRFGRKWVSEFGENLLFSVLLYPEQKMLSNLNVIASLSLLRAIQQETTLLPTLKWPNDVLLRGKKVGGILIETAVLAGRVKYAIIGFGVNINSNPTQVPEISKFSTSIANELGRDVSRETLFETVLVQLSDSYNSLREWMDVRNQWESYLETIGSHVRVVWGNETEEGLAEGVDYDGNLVLRRSDGTTVTLSGGDVTLKG
jgi:BirA family biotin operon repressor/biotin-[acetyl-CoA-carboxylase] ligase